jgi:hypothetical protein
MEKTVKKREVKMLPGKKAYYANSDIPVAEQKENFKGKHYYSFAFGKSVFNVHEEDEFITEWNNKTIKEIMIDVEEQGATLLNFATRQELIDDAMFEGDIDYARNRYKYEASKPLTIANLEETAGL